MLLKYFQCDILLFCLKVLNDFDIHDEVDIP